jgi:subtilisin family serine protease
MANALFAPRNLISTPSLGESELTGDSLLSPNPLTYRSESQTSNFRNEEGETLENDAVAGASQPEINANPQANLTGGEKGSTHLPVGAPLFTLSAGKSDLTAPPVFDESDFQTDPVTPERDEKPSQTGEASFGELEAGASYAPGELIVKVKSDTRPSDVEALQQALGASVLETTKTLGIQRWAIAAMSVEDAIAIYGSDPRVEYLEPNYLVSVAQTLPNDPNFGELWGLNNTGQAGGTPDADIDAPEAWDISTGSDAVVVGVIDTGVDYTHPDLANNIWTNPGEIAGDGLDNDGNGYVDDVHGYDFVYEDSDPMDVYGHGTHVAGTIAAEGNNNIGVVGVNWNAQIMPLKFLNDDGYGYTFDAIQAVEYATLMKQNYGVNINLTNNSWGGGGYEQSLYDAIAAAGNAGQLFIAAAGNYSNNNDLYPFYPASYNLDNIISVAATDRYDQLAYFSNYGATTVDLGAPGVDVLSTIPGGGYATYSGTSMASPHVSGVAALLWSLDSGLSAQEVKDLILQTAEPIAALSGITVTGGRLNAYNALNAIVPPVELIGTEGDDVLTGTNGADLISGLGGNDILQGLGGNDQISGGSGNDLISGGDGQDTLAGEAGNDNINGDRGDDVITGGDGRDDIFAGDGNDSVSGGAGVDRILGESGNDTLTGDGGNDTLDGGEGADSVAGGKGQDRLFGGGGNDSLFGESEADNLTGGLGNDSLNGGAGNDTLIGVDPLVAGSGAGFGAGEVDTLLAGSDSDTFVLGDASHVYYDDGDPLSTGEPDYALLTDFNASEDLIQLQGSADLYRLDFFTSSAGTTDAALIYDAGVTARWETISFLQNASPPLSLTSPPFTFVSSPSTTVAAVKSGQAVSPIQNLMGSPSTQQQPNQTEIPLPIDLFDSLNFRWDVQGDGSIGDGTNDAYDGGLRLANFPFFSTGQIEDNGREVVIGLAAIDGVQVTRKIYVPEAQSWARFLEIVANTSSSAVNYTVDLNTNLGSNGQTVLVGTSSGDIVFNTEDNWLVTDDVDGEGDPTMLHVIAGENGIRPNATSLNFDDINFQYNLTLAPGETQVVMHFAVQNLDQATALAKAPELTNLELDALAGMSQEELQGVVNFLVAPPAELIGTEGDDVLTGTDGPDLISGLGGNDILQGLGGNDQISGGTGNDLVSAGDGKDTVTGDEGNDILLGGDGDDSLSGGLDSDQVLGEKGNDAVSGDAGNDTLDGGEGDDLVSGGTDSDRLFGSKGTDSLFGDEGLDTLTGGLGNDSLDGGAGDDTLIGIDPLVTGGGVGFGATEVDTLLGGSDRDTFVLGDSNRVYYDDGDPLSTGESDYALLLEFNASEDFIQLKGSADLYSLDFFTSSAGTIDAALIYDPGVTARGEVIGFLQGVSPDLSLNSSAFTFV